MRDKVEARTVCDVAEPFAISGHRLAVNQLLLINSPLAVARRKPKTNQRVRFKRLFLICSGSLSSTSQPENAAHDSRILSGNLLDGIQLEFAFFHQSDRLEIVLDLFAYVGFVIQLRCSNFPFIDLNAIPIRLQLFYPFSFMIV